MTDSPVFVVTKISFSRFWIRLHRHRHQSGQTADWLARRVQAGSSSAIRLLRLWGLNWLVHLGELHQADAAWEFKNILEIMIIKPWSVCSLKLTRSQARWLQGIKPPWISKVESSFYKLTGWFGIEIPQGRFSDNALSFWWEFKLFSY